MADCHFFRWITEYFKHVSGLISNVVNTDTSYKRKSSLGSSIIFMTERGLRAIKVTSAVPDVGRRAQHQQVIPIRRAEHHRLRRRWRACEQLSITELKTQFWDFLTVHLTQVQADPFVFWGKRYNACYHLGKQYSLHSVCFYIRV